MLAAGASHSHILPSGALQGYQVGWFAPTYRILEPAWREAKKRLRPLIAEKNESLKTMQLVTGGSVEFWSLDDADSGRSRKYKRVIVDEAAMVRNLKDAWEQAIRPTLTDLVGDAWFLSTPKGINFFHELFLRGSAQARLYSSWQLPTSCNPYIKPGEIEEARDDLPELVFAQEYGAQFVTMGAGLVKPDHILPGVPPTWLDGKRQPPLPVVLGVDLAISEREGADWTVILAMSRDPDSGLVYVREVERHRIGFAETLAKIKAAAQRWSPTTIAIEQVQYQAAVVQELARTTTLPVRGIRPDRDKVTRFAPLLTRYEQRLVRHDPVRVPPWFVEELLAFPEGQFDDGVDAASLAFSALRYTQAQPLGLKVANL